MAYDKVFTEHDVARLQRHAFIAGSQWDSRMSAKRNHWQHGEDSIPEAEQRYPLPTVTRQREVRDGPWAFRATDGVIEARVIVDGNWGAIDEDMHESFAIALTSTRVAIWADLLANPTEEVEG